MFLSILSKLQINLLHYLAYTIFKKGVPAIFIILNTFSPCCLTLKKSNISDFRGHQNFIVLIKMFIQCKSFKNSFNFLNKNGSYFWKNIKQSYGCKNECRFSTNLLQRFKVRSSCWRSEKS